MKTKTILLTAAAAVSMASCTNDPGPDFNPGKTVEVVSLSDYLPAESRSDVKIKNFSSSRNPYNKTSGTFNRVAIRL